MNIRIITLLFLLVSTILFSQTNIDKITAELDLLNNAYFDDWKYSLDFNVSMDELSKMDFDDSKWSALKLNEGLSLDSCIMRKVIEIPGYVSGKQVKGKLNLFLTVDDYGFLFINGVSKGKINWSGEFPLTGNASPGDKFVLVIKAINTGGPMKIINAKLDIENNSEIRQTISDFILSLKTGQKLLGFDTYQTNGRVKVDPGIDKSTTDPEYKKKLTALFNSSVEKLDIESLRDGDTLKFLKSLERIRKELKPVSEYAKQFTLHFTANAHIDAAWLWRKKETVDVCYHTFSSVMNMFDARTDGTTTNFAYAQSQAVYYEWMKNLYPDLFNEIKEKVKTGNWEIVGGMWVEPDCNLPDGISWSRQLLYAQKFFEDNFGKRAVIGWNPDSFGYNRNMPSFFLNSGIDVFITQKIGWNDTSVFPYRVFWWEGPDGSRILAYFPFSYVNDIEKPFEIVDWLRQFEANTSYKNMLVLFGVGNHGGGPSIEMMKKTDRLQKVDIFPTIKYGTSDEYITWLKKQNPDEIPVWKDELYLEYHRGTYTTQSNTKKNNRTAEVLLSNAEKLASFATLAGSGFSYPDKYLTKAWKTALLNQFHDILPGSSIREVYIDSEQDYKSVFELGEYVKESSLKAIASGVNTSSLEKGEPVIVFNSLSWKRNDLVKVKLPKNSGRDYSIYNTDGSKVESQVIELDDLNNEIIFIAEGVPALGYKIYELRNEPGVMNSGRDNKAFSVETSRNEPPKLVDASIENEFFKVTVDADSGWVKSIFDKKNNKELLTGYGNKLQLLEDKPNAWDAWNIGLTGKEFPTKFRKIEFAESGPVRNIIRVYRDYLKPGTKKEFPTEDFPSSFFTQDIILYKGIDRIDFVTGAEWFEEKTMVKVLFPVSVSDTVATYEIPYGTIERSTTLEGEYNKGKWEVSGLRWADLSDSDYGVSLLNKAKYGYDIKGSNMRLSLLRSPKWPDKTADMGFHKMEYSIYPHTGGAKDAGTIKRGYGYNNELIGMIVEKASGSMPLENSFVTIYPENIILTSVKKAEGKENEFVYQFYESDGKKTDTKLSFPGNPKRAEYTNFIEDDGEPIKLDGNSVKLNVNANGIMTIKVIY